MYCLDSSIIIAIMRGDEELKKRLEELDNLEVEYCITTPSVMEIYKGAYKAKNREAALAAVRKFVNNVKVVNLSIVSCDLFAHDLIDLEKKGQSIPEFDVMIASIAQAEGKVLVTRDKHFERLPHLRIEIW